MEEDLEAIQERLLDELKDSVYPSHRSAIRNRYTDTSYLIFKTSEAGQRSSFLSFGSRRSSLASNYGNTPTFIRRSFSSNGMLEYTEQVGGTKHRPGHVLPYITKEEREMEDVEEKSMLAEAVEEKSMLAEAERVDEEEGEVLRIDNNINKIEPLEKDLLKDSVSLEYIDKGNNESDSTDYSTKNRKIFLHYDMPLSKRPPIKNSVMPDTPETSKDSELKVEPSVENSVNVENFNGDNSKENMDIKVLHLPKIPLDPICNQVTSKVETSPEIPLDPICNQVTSKVETSPGIDSLVVKEDEASVMSPQSLERASSINEKNGTTFPRASANRCSLRELPRRSPTPPKRSPRRTKKEKSTKPQPDDILPVSNTSVLPKRSNATTSNERTLPPLVSSTSENSEINNDRLLSSLATVEKIDSYQSLDDTPLYIVEEGDNLVKSFQSPSTVQIKHLVGDNKVNKSFIVVHSPTSNSNSLGLAPLAVKSKKSSSTSSVNSQTHLNSRKNYYSHTVEHSTSTQKNFSSRTSTSSTSTSTFYSSKESSHVQLLKFSKSEDDPKFVIPSPNGAMNKSYLVSKGKIRSSPINGSIENSRYSSKDFTDTDFSRVCSVM